MAVLQGKLDAITGGPKLFVDVAFLVVNIMGNTIFRADAHAQSRLFWAEQRERERQRDKEGLIDVGTCRHTVSYDVICFLFLCM